MKGKGGVIRAGSRGSALALCQTGRVVDSLRKLYTEYQFSIVLIHTRGDQDPEAPLAKIGGKGVFVAELEAALLASRIDLAVHSFKDLPTQLSPGLTIGAVVERDDPRDALVSASGSPLGWLPLGARLGTGSPRRRVQLKNFRPDLEFCHIRGNIDTRLHKMRTQGLDGIILAAAGLARLGWEDKITEYLPAEICLPAVGQGAIAVEIRADDEEMAALVLPLDHLPTRQAVIAERSFLQGLGGGCQAPIAALGGVRDELLELEGVVASEDGEKLLRAKDVGLVDNPEEVGKRLARWLWEMGAGEILAGQK